MKAAQHNATTSFYGYDAHKNIVFLTDGAGMVTDAYEYDAWGNLVRSTGTTSNTRLYAGEELDPDTGLVNLRARQYRPGTGRFFTMDPLLLGAFLNRYLFTGGDPISHRDPTGRIDATEDALDTERGQIFSSANAAIFLGAFGTTTHIAAFASEGYVKEALDQLSETAAFYAGLSLASIGSGAPLGFTGVGLTLLCALETGVMSSADAVPHLFPCVPLNLFGG